jgi:hypothetical protein
MDVWGWIAVYAVGLTLLQLLVYRYLLNNGGSLSRRVGTPFSNGERETSWSNGSSGSSGRSGQSETPRPPQGPDGGGTRPSASNPRPGERPVRDTPGPAPDGTDGRRCPHCGAANESDETFTHCWNCTREL